MPRLATTIKSFAAAAALAAALPAAASAAPVHDGTFTPSGQPVQITTGPDGAAWFTLAGSTANKEFGRIAADGTITEFDTPAAQNATALTAAGGSIWLGYDSGVIKVDPANPNAGVATPSGAKINGNPLDMAADGAGNVWVVDGNGVVRVNTAAAPTFDDVPSGAGGREIALGGDGRMWWADFGGSAIQATTTGAVPATTKVIDTPSAPQGIAAGPGTQMAFGAPNNLAGRISPGGAAQYTTDTGGDWGFGIALGADGAYWAPRFPKDSLGRLTTDGGYTTPITLPAGSGPRRIAAGAGNTLWVTLELSKQIARISGVTAPVATPPATPPAAPRDTVKPRLARLKVDVAKRRLSVRLSEAASLRVTIEKRTFGKRKGKKCQAAKKGRTGKKCVRYVKVRSLRKAGKAGANTVSLGKKLGPARYRVSLVAVDKAGNRSATARKGFTVKKPRKKSR
jgi:virginiamycin B lyase